MNARVKQSDGYWHQLSPSIPMGAHGARSSWHLPYLSTTRATRSSIHWWLALSLVATGSLFTILRTPPTLHGSAGSHATTRHPGARRSSFPIFPAPRFVSDRSKPVSKSPSSTNCAEVIQKMRETLVQNVPDFTGEVPILVGFEPLNATFTEWLFLAGELAVSPPGILVHKDGKGFQGPVLVHSHGHILDFVDQVVPLPVGSHPWWTFPRHWGRGRDWRILTKAVTLSEALKGGKHNMQVTATESSTRDMAEYMLGARLTVLPPPTVMLRKPFNVPEPDLPLAIIRRQDSDYTGWLLDPPAVRAIGDIKTNGRPIMFDVVKWPVFVKSISSISPPSNEEWTMHDLETYVEYAFNTTALGSVIITDDVTVHILGMLLNIPHILINDKSGQVFNFHKTWSQKCELAQKADSFQDAVALAGAHFS